MSQTSVAWETHPKHARQQRAVFTTNISKLVQFCHPSFQRCGQVLGSGQSQVHAKAPPMAVGSPASEGMCLTHQGCFTTSFSEITQFMKNTQFMKKLNDLVGGQHAGGNISKQESAPLNLNAEKVHLDKLHNNASITDADHKKLSKQLNDLMMVGQPLNLNAEKVHLDKVYKSRSITDADYEKLSKQLNDLMMVGQPLNLNTEKLHLDKVYKSRSITDADYVKLSKQLNDLMTGGQPLNPDAEKVHLDNLYKSGSITDADYEKLSKQLNDLMMGGRLAGGNISKQESAPLNPDTEKVHLDKLHKNASITDADYEKLSKQLDDLILGA